MKSGAQRNSLEKGEENLVIEKRKLSKKRKTVLEKDHQEYSLSKKMTEICESTEEEFYAHTEEEFICLR